MTYNRLTLTVPNSPQEGVRLTAVQLGVLDRALFEQDARITTLEALVVALDARITTLENA